MHPWDLADPAPRLPPADALVHLALAHVPGAYRGGEGDDPAGFRRLNLDGTLRLFDAAGPARIVFLSSRAVYGDHRRGETLRETDAPAPDSLYGDDQARGRGARSAAAAPRSAPPASMAAPAQVAARSSPPTCAAKRSRRAPPPSCTAPTSPPPSCALLAVPETGAVQRLGPAARPPRPARAGAGADRLPAPAAAARRRPAARRHGLRPPPRPRLAPRRPGPARRLARRNNPQGFHTG